jgi:hypothetical protein
MDQNVSRGPIERTGGQLVLAAGRTPHAISIGVVGYQVGADNTREWLGEQVTETLAALELKATII